MFSFLNQLLHFMSRPLPPSASHFLRPIRVFNLHNGKQRDSHPNLPAPTGHLFRPKNRNLRPVSFASSNYVLCEVHRKRCPPLSLSVSLCLLLFSFSSSSISSFCRCSSRFTHFYDSHSAPSEIGDSNCECYGGGGGGRGVMVFEVMLWAR